MMKSLFGHKAWANTELFDVLETLTPGPDAHTAIRLMNHIYVVDRIFQAHLLGQPHGYDATNTKATPTLAELRGAVAEADAWYQEYVATLNEAALAEPLGFNFTDGDTGTMSREEMLMHVITHGAYHRGNVGQILKNAAIAPPRDLLTKFLHIAEPARRG
ncbi:DinB family protein [Rugamonas apoptosis]|nr:DinB family protein [Rugamonas apoptosis]